MMVSKDSIKRAVRTFVIATLGLLIPGLLGWLNELTSWARNAGGTPFPDAHGLVYIVVAAICGGVIALLNLLVNWVEDTAGKGVLREVTSPEELESSPESAT